MIYRFSMTNSDSILPTVSEDVEISSATEATLDARINGDATIRQFYDEVGLNFEFLDSADVFRRADTKLVDRNCRNLVVDFGNEQAWCGWDLQGETDALKLHHKRPDEVKTRWIAIFSPHEQAQFVQTLVAKYGLSPRHTAALLSRPGSGNLEIAQKLWHWSSVENGEHFLSLGFNALHNIVSKKVLRDEGPRDHALDVVDDDQGSSSVSSSQLKNWMEFLKYRKKHDKTTLLPLSVSSVGDSESQTSTIHKDNASSFHERKMPDIEVAEEHANHQYNHTGADHHKHEHFGLKSEEANDEDEEDGDEENLFEPDHDDQDDMHFHPKMLRNWVWLITTDDGTVISLHEPLPRLKNAVRDPYLERDMTAHIRRTMRVVLRCLSKAPMMQRKSRISEYELAMEKGALALRASAGRANDLLLYYLFDDWYASWSLAVDRAHPYSKKLKLIKDSDPDLHHIDDLHDITRRLASLKRVYQSYEVMLSRILDNKFFVKEKNWGIDLSVSALSRFDRLKQRVTYLAIAEIEDCENEAKNLISLTYNRLNFRETKAVEKLTLLTVALAKVTILFLPLSIIMAFFSMQVEGISDRYNANVFWVSISIALFLTIIFLLAIGRMSGTVEIARLWRMMVKKIKGESGDQSKGRTRRNEGIHGEKRTKLVKRRTG